MNAVAPVMFALVVDSCVGIHGHTAKDVEAVSSMPPGAKHHFPFPVSPQLLMYVRKKMMTQAEHRRPLAEIPVDKTEFGMREGSLLGMGFVFGAFFSSGIFFVAGFRRTRSPMAAVGRQCTEEPSCDDPEALVDATPRPNVDTQDLESFAPRYFILCVMLLVQSLSSVILYMFDEFLDDHTDLLYFFTMLVGVGGNASGQSLVLTIRRAAIGLDTNPFEQALVGFMLGGCLAPVAFIRTAVQVKDTSLCTTVALSCLVITMAGTFLGTLIPMSLKCVSADPGHASPLAQVSMDMTGTLVVCAVGVAVYQTLN
eukprot:TRINITY_DN32281_c0_g1_i4.p1 TRINITY_DN32281_c0_g1~~TRINITY_DN32281_c0_g1_i4.p1  ORF type:complete len:312 (+),score=45.53 TRINITY_DN32281_c0_g1_i4:81-1016(+)